MGTAGRTLIGLGRLLALRVRMLMTAAELPPREGCGDYFYSHLGPDGRPVCRCGVAAASH